MKVIHGIWTPASSKAFIQTGQFSIWIETDEVASTKSGKNHPQQFSEKDGLDFLKESFAYTVESNAATQSQSIYLPTLGKKPLPSPELSPSDMEGELTISAWQVISYPLLKPFKTLGDIYFLSHYQHNDICVGTDLLFWYFFSQSLKQVFYKDQYISGLVAEKMKTKTKLYRRWKIASPSYEALIEQSVKSMPLACYQNHAAESLLRHFSDVLVNQLLEKSVQELPKVFRSKVQNDFVETLLFDKQADQPIKTTATIPESFKQWHRWQQKLLPTQATGSLQLGFQLYEADTKQVDNWQLSFILSSHKDLSFKLDLSEFWSNGDAYQALIKQQFGRGIEQQILVNLAHAAKIYPKLWAGMETAEPSSVTLTLEEAFTFLQESAWVLEDAGFRIIVPARLTPKGRQRAKMRLRSGSSKSTSNKSAKSYLSLDDLTDYRYEFAIGDEKVSVQEWEQLVEMKMSLVYFRGQWVELDQDKMQEMLKFWQQQQDNPDTLSVQELLQKLAEEGDSLEIDVNDKLSDMMANLLNHSELALIDNPPQLQAQLRDYQKRGVSWLRFLESLGLNGCLADDMGLGKTMQVIAALIMEKEENDAIGPTLLIAPTSVIGNWQKEIQKFAPHLKTAIHHGSQREKDKKAFGVLCKGQDMLITSYTLARKDSALLSGVDWHRIVLDEAQNIKNPKAAQTKAIFKLEAKHRLALTGTPVENRLMDLWSIFNFLNPGYLGKQAQFRKNYELPIQRDNNKIQSTVLKQLTQPFILRRLKTDKSIIKDLPEKIENKQYCNLSKEQASLYQAVVKEVEEQLEESEGIQRQGLMLSTLMKLKQICNHPMQFLQDDSAFTADRSHKLTRLTEMLAEAVAEGDSILIFTQFTEIGDKLTDYCRQEKYPCHYLHGGISREKREKMIESFQDPETPPAIFVLSLKAGGVGITLTRANHVFHFDRWWNPAVENQATDRAFRIGQKKNVMVHKFITLGTLEERIDQMIDDKQKMADSIIGNDESWLTKLDNRAFKKLIALNKNSIMED